MLGGIRRFAIIGAGLLTLGIGVAPASASGVAAGVISGTANASPGFYALSPIIQNQSYTLSVANPLGTAATTQCAGVLDASATVVMFSTVETFAAGVGTFTMNLSGICTVGSINMGCASGTYVRLGVLLTVATECIVAGQATASAFVIPVAEFVPNQPPQYATSWTWAGPWVLATA